MSRKMAEGSLNPMLVKRRMAREIVSEFHGPEAAQAAEEAFVRQFSQRQLPAEMPEYRLAEPVNVVTLMVEAKLAASRNEARRLIQQGGVSFFPDGSSGQSQTVQTPDFMVPPSEGAVLKVGKLRYLRIRSA